MHRPRRVLIWGNVKQGYSWFVQGTLQGAYLNECWVKSIDLRTSTIDFLREQSMWFRPDYLFCHVLFHAWSNTQGFLHLLSQLRKNGTKVCYVMGDVWPAPRHANDISDAVDLGLVNNFDPGVQQVYKDAWKIPIIWWPYACMQQHEIAAVDMNYANMFIYTGNLFPESIYTKRTRFVQALARQTPLHVVQTGLPLEDLRYQTPTLASSTNAILSMPADLDTPGYIDVRPFQYGGAGAVLIQRWTDALARILDRDEHVFAFDNLDVEQVAALYAKICAAPAEATRRRVRLFTLMQQKHTYTLRVKEVFDYFEGRK